jgi:multiple sugar transport system permease protein
VKPLANSGSAARRLPTSRSGVGWLLVAPALLGFCLFYLMPTLRTLGVSFTRWNLLSPAHFIGLENYQRLLGDERFWNSLKVTVLYVLYNIPLQTALALWLAVLLARCERSLVLRSVMLLPFLVSNVIAAMIWFWLLDPVLGFGNTLLTAFGIERQAFLSDPNLALPSLAVINIWRHVGFNALLLYTGLQAIPRHLYEAASLEGARPWTVFRRITLPLLRPVLGFVLVTSVIGSFQVFDTIVVTTQGGPGYATETIMWYVYQSAFGSFRMGYASAMSCVLFAGLVAVTAVQMRALRAHESDLG